MKLSCKQMILFAAFLLVASVGWAQRTYPASQPLPKDVVWMREIYRTLDLTRDTNGALYYPVEPQEGRMNLFTTLFRLLAQNKIKVYEYQLDGTERFKQENEVSFRDVLQRFQIYHEMKKVKDRRDSVMSIHNSDIPSADVLSYFIKEVWYFDQRTSSYGSVVTALCPVLHRSEEFSTEPVKLPMFWINLTEVAPLLAHSQISTSNYNNAATGSWNDYFGARLYKGDIYKATNLQNRTLAQYCPTDSAMLREQRRIEQELLHFEQSLYGKDIEQADSLTTLPAKGIKAKTKKKGRNHSVATSRKQTSGSAQRAPKQQSSSPKASVRRERR